MWINTFLGLQLRIFHTRLWSTSNELKSCKGILIWLTLNSTATMWRVAEHGRIVALGCRRPARAVRQYQKNSECQGKRLVLKYGSPIRTEICRRGCSLIILSWHVLKWHNETQFYSYVLDTTKYTAAQLEAELWQCVLVFKPLGGSQAVVIFILSPVSTVLVSSTLFTSWTFQQLLANCVCCGQGALCFA